MNLRHPRIALSLGFRFRLLVAVPLIAGVLLSGCTTLRSVPLPSPGQPSQAEPVKIGDHVQVQLKSGERFDFKVTAIEPNALVGKDVRVKFQDMAGLQVKRVDPVRTGAAVVGGAAVLAVVAILVVWASGGIAFMPAGPS